MSKRPVTVTSHAIDQAARRFRATYPESARDVRDVVRLEVERALEAGRIANHKREGFILYGEKRRSLPAGQRFVWSEDDQRAWIIVRETSYDAVVTSLSRVGTVKKGVAA
jgi:hypothetical protein